MNSGAGNDFVFFRSPSPRSRRLVRLERQLHDLHPPNKSNAQECRPPSLRSRFARHLQPMRLRRSRVPCNTTEPSVASSKQSARSPVPADSLAKTPAPAAQMPCQIEAKPNRRFAKKRASSAENLSIGSVALIEPALRRKTNNNRKHRSLFTRCQILSGSVAIRSAG